MGGVPDPARAATVPWPPSVQKLGGPGVPWHPQPPLPKGNPGVPGLVPEYLMPYPAA